MDEDDPFAAWDPDADPFKGWDPDAAATPVQTAEVDFGAPFSVGVAPEDSGDPEAFYGPPTAEFLAPEGERVPAKFDPRDVDPLGAMLEAFLPAGTPRFDGNLTEEMRRDLGIGAGAAIEGAVSAPMTTANRLLDIGTRPLQAMGAGFTGGLMSSTARTLEAKEEGADEVARAMSLLTDFDPHAIPSDRAGIAEFVFGAIPVGAAATRLSKASRADLIGRKVTIPEGAGSITRITPAGEVTVTIPTKGAVETTVDALRMSPEAGALRLPDPNWSPIKAGVNWLMAGEKGRRGGKSFAGAVVRLKDQLGNVPGLAQSEGAKVRNAFAAVSKAPQEAFEAVHENLFRGTPIPEAIREKYGSALPPLRRSLSELGELRATIKDIDPAVLDEYPVWLKRYFEEPLALKAAKGGAPPSSPVPGIAKRFARQDAYTSKVYGLDMDEAQEIIDRLPPQERPFQPTAPGMSKGVVTGKDRDILIKWPETPDGRAGRAKFREAAEAHPSAQKRTVTIDDTDPIPADAENLTEIRDLPTVLSRSWADVMRLKANEEFFDSLPGMVDDANGQPLTKFVSASDYRKGNLPSGYEVMTDDGIPSRRWGALNRAVDGEATGYHAVRSDVAQLLRGYQKASGSSASMAHGFLDAWAQNVTNAPRTGLMNVLYNKVFVEPINGLFPGSPFKKEAKRLVREWEQTGEVPEILKPPMQEGLPLRAPDEGMASIEDAVDSMFENSLEAKNQAYDNGRRLYDIVAASPLAERPMEAAMGGAAQGALRGAAEGWGPLGIAVETLSGAAMPLLGRKVAIPLREAYVNSDLFTTVAAYLKHLDEAGGDVARATAKTIDLTQSGQWSRVGGFSEVLGAAPAGIYGAERSGIRAAQKAFLNRFAKFQEVDARLKINAVRHGWKSAAAAGLTGAAILAIKGNKMLGIPSAGERAAQAMGIIDPEESEVARNLIPDSITIPTWNFHEGKPAVVTVPGHSVGSVFVEVPDDLREFASQVTGPAAATTAELLGGEKAQTLLTGAPLRRTEPEEGTIEDAPEAFIRSNQTRWMSPWASPGRLTQALREQVPSMDLPGRPGTPRTGEKPSTVPEVLAGLVLGRVREFDPSSAKVRGLKAFNAQKLEIEKEATRARKAAIPALRPASAAQRDERIATLAKEYLDKGYTEAELGLSSSVKAILSKRRR